MRPYVAPRPVMTARFCSQCGTRLRARKVNDGRRPVCPSCGFVAYDDPKVAVGVLAARRGRLVLVKRDQEPRRGEWSFPSGYVDAGEGLEEAAIRETFEETGLTVRLLHQIGAFARKGERVVFIAYAASVLSGRLAAGPECQDARYFDLDALPALAFDHDLEIVRAWQAL